MAYVHYKVTYGCSQSVVNLYVADRISNTMKAFLVEGRLRC